MRKIVFISAALSMGLSYAQDSLKTVQLEELAVTAIRAQEGSPVARTNIQRGDIRSIDFGQDASLTLEALSPSIITFSDAGSAFGNYHQFRLRGIDQSRVNVTLNGAPLNDMIDQGVFFSNFPDFSGSMQSIQVQRGIGLSTNGTASYAGSISYQAFDITKANPEYGVTLSGGSFGSWAVNGEVFTGLKDKGWSAYFRTSKLSSDGFKNNSGSDAHSFFLSTGKQFENSLFKLTAFSGRAQNQQAYSPVILSDIEADPKTNYFPRQDQDDFKQEFVQLDFSSKTGKVVYNVAGYYGGARGYFPFTFGDQFIYSLQNDHLGAMANVSIVGENSRLTGGLHAYQFDRTNESATVVTLNSPYYADETSKNEFSQFWKFEQDIGDLTILLDAQIRSVEMIFVSDSLTKYYGDQKSTRSESFFNPKIGLTYNLSGQSQVYASLGRTGREPTRTDLMQGAFDGVESWNYQAFTNNSVVKSEFVTDLEIGYRFRSTDFNLAVNAFYMDFDNEISQVGGLVQNSYFVLRQNVRNSQRMGIEIEADYSLESLTIGLMGTFMNSNVDEFDTGTEVLNDVQHVFSPKTMLIPSIGWTSKKWTIGADARFIGASFMELSNDPEYVLPAYNVLNLSLSYELNEKIRISGRVNNILDELYYTDGAPVDFEFDGTPEGPGYRVQAPRNFLLRAAFNF